MERYLVHHGIKGQKWGIRRFQNPDGTLTAAGRRRYNREGGGEGAQAAPRQPRPRKITGNRALAIYGGSAIGAAAIAAQSRFSGEDVDSAKKFADKTNKDVQTWTKIKSDERRAQVRSKARAEARAYSDDDLKRIIKRWENEKKYVDLSESQIEFGRDNVDKILQTATLALGAVSAGLTVASALKSLAEKKKG